MEFGRNGAVLQTDEQTEAEFVEVRKNDLDLCISAALQLAGYAGLVTYFSFALPGALSDPFVDVLFLIGFLCVVIPSAAAFAQRAIDNQKLPEKAGAKPIYKHISGWVAAASLALVASVLYLAFEASAELAHNGNFEIPGDWGDGVLGAVAFVFLAAIFGPRLSNTVPARMMSSASTALDYAFGWLGRIASVADSWLVFIVAPMVGVTQRRTRARYGLLFGNLAPCCVAGWFLPAPLGLIAIAWAFLVIISVARRWAWVEEDREIAMLNANFSSERLRVGFDEDLSDETLWSYLSLLALLPLMMHQCNVWDGGHLFGVKHGADPSQLGNPFAWLAYYGTELAKALPFVDWSEVYDVHGASDIVLGKVASRHVVFVARAVTDLVLLAALLQAIAIAARTRKQMQLFRDAENSLDRLDPFVEPVELRKLVEFRDGSWRPIAVRVSAFPKYNAFRLHEIRAHEDKSGPLFAAATALLRSRPDFSELNEKFMEVTSPKKLNPTNLATAFQAVQSANLFDLDTLEYVRRQLNWKAGYQWIRTAIVKAIIDNIPASAERTTALRRVLVDAQIGDSLAPIRLMVLGPLRDAWNVGHDRKILAALRKAAQDHAASVREAATEILREIGDDGGDETPPDGSSSPAGSKREFA